MGRAIVQLLEGEVLLKRAGWILLLFLLSAVACALAIPQTDLPETAYNEVDRPVNQAPPVVPGITLVRPARNRVLLPRELRLASRNVPAHVLEPTSGPVLACHYTHSFQDLFCVFLI